MHPLPSLPWFLLGSVLAERFGVQALEMTKPGFESKLWDDEMAQWVEVTAAQT